MRRLSLTLLAASLLPAQSTSPERKETMTVTGAYQPIPLGENDRSVSLYDRESYPAGLFGSVADLLRQDSSVDLRSRAPNAIQSDLSLRGGAFGQALVLLDGMRLNDPQSAHHNMDIPLPLDAIARIEILKGAGSSFYGADAVDGAVNVITRQPDTSEMRLRTAVGNFGVNQQSGEISLVAGSWSGQLSFSRDFSSGFIQDRDYRNLSFGSITRWRNRWGQSTFVAANSDRPFGADQFYGNFNSWERTKEWFVSARQSIGESMEASIAWRRHTDLFVLYRDRPQVFTNRHIDDSLSFDFRRNDRLGRNIRLHYGIDGYHDSVDSTNLGAHHRNRGAAYAALDLRALHRFSFQLAAREEVFSGGQTQLSPTASAAYWLSPGWKLRASVSHAFRLPSYTDLYYHDPGNIGSPNLKPEKANEWEAGAEWNHGNRLRASATIFQRRERDGIDYVRYSPTDVYRATNFDRLTFTGAEATFEAAITQTQRVNVSCTVLRGAQDVALAAYSKYLFNYPVRNAVVAWNGLLPYGIAARTRIGVVDRRARPAYGLWDVSAASSRGRLRPYLQLTNLADAAYQEVLGVPQPGRAVVVGVEAVVFGKR